MCYEPETSQLLSATGRPVCSAGVLGVVSNTGSACVVKQRRRSCCQPQVGLCATPVGLLFSVQTLDVRVL
jgi:hypothetical protein